MRKSRASWAFSGKLDPDLKERIMEIHVDEQKSLKIYLHNGIPVILGTYENADSKLKTFKAICQELEAKKIKAQYIDLTYEKPYNTNCKGGWHGLSDHREKFFLFLVCLIIGTMVSTQSAVRNTPSSP